MKKRIIYNHISRLSSITFVRLSLAFPLGSKARTPMIRCMDQKTEENNYSGLLLKTALAIKHATHVECHNQDIVTLLRP